MESEEQKGEEDRTRRVDSRRNKGVRHDVSGEEEGGEAGEGGEEKG